MKRLAIGLLLAVTLAALAASCGLPYYSQAVWGHGRLLAKRQAISRLLSRSDLDPELRRRLTLLVEIRDFASEVLALPDNKSYRQYVELDRPHAVWNVLAAPELSVAPVEWCFPIAGCVSYRGYFSEGRAQAYARELSADGLDTYVYGVAAYSTLGWFADPVLSSFAVWPEMDLAELLFHELAHQVVYLAGDTAFNESFASLVAEVGVERWLEVRAKPASIADYRRRLLHQHAFAELVGDYRSRLESAYAGDGDAEGTAVEKKRLLGELKTAYAERSGSWRTDARYDAWFAQELNNAHLVSINSYHQLVPGFRELLESCDGELPRFFAVVAEFAAVSEEQRLRRLATGSEAMLPCAVKDS